jgi:hypothetical protein
MNAICPFSRDARRKTLAVRRFVTKKEAEALGLNLA